MVGLGTRKNRLTWMHSSVRYVWTTLYKFGNMLPLHIYCSPAETLFVMVKSLRLQTARMEN